MATKLKTNKAMRLGSVMLVLALLTTCAISGTFAKYTTETSASDTARVAKWGIGESSLAINDLFKSAYDSTVKSTTDVIAPGTSNSTTFKITADAAAAPEVDYTFTVNTTGSTCDDDIKNNPNIKWSFDTATDLTWDQLMTKIAALSSTETVKAGNFPNGADSAEHTIGWEWAFSTSDDQDTADTAMGNKTNLDNVKIVINFAATQVD